MYLSIKRTSRSKLYIYACIYWILRFEVLPSSWEMHISVKSTLYELWEKNSLVVVSVVMMHFPANPGGALNTLFIFKRKLRIVLSIAKGRVRTIAISKLSLQSALVRRLLGSQRGNISIRYVSWEVMTHKMEMSAFILYSSPVHRITDDGQAGPFHILACAFSSLMWDHWPTWLFSLDWNHNSFQ